MVLVAYVSGHGFGHATRVVTVLNRIATIAPGSRLVVRTSAPQWFLEQSATAPITIEPVEADTGAAQITSFAVDVPETARRAARFYRAFDDRAAEEASYLRRAGASVVLGDVPPLAFAAASRAGVPSVALANFTWDWIYQGYPEFERLAPGTLPVIQRAYRQATATLRLPFHGGFEGMSRVTDIPLIARQSALGQRPARQRLGLPGDAQVVLASFGGHGSQIDLQGVARQNAFTLLATDYEGLPDSSSTTPVLQSHTAAGLRALGLRYEDLVAAADVVVSKPGYGIVSECIANDTALLYTSRGRFAEHDVLVSGMRPALRSRFIDQDTLMSGSWQPAVDALLAQAVPTQRMPTNGAEIAATALMAYDSE